MRPFFTHVAASSAHFCRGYGLFMATWWRMDKIQCPIPSSLPRQFSTHPIKEHFTRYAALFVAACCIATTAVGQQSIAPTVNNLASLELTSSNTLYTASIGETAVTTITSGNHTITQGFLQPEILPCIDLTFNYYPNPAQDIITVEALGCEIQIETLQIYDLWGRHLTTARATRNNQLNLGDLAQGMYYVKVTLSNQLTYSLTVIKTSN